MLKSAQYYRDAAARCRTMSSLPGWNSAECQSGMAKMAEGYDHIARSIEAYELDPSNEVNFVLRREARAVSDDQPQQNEVRQKEAS